MLSDTIPTSITNMPFLYFNNIALITATPAIAIPSMAMTIPA